MPPIKNLKVALLPHDIISCDVRENLRMVQLRINTFDSDTNLVVLPEMFTTGFTTKMDLINKIAETNTELTISTICELANRKDLAISGSFVAQEKGNFYNRGFLVTSCGQISFYDKRHLFSAGGEAKIFTAGTDISPIISLNGWNIKMAICYDIRFPVWNRTRANDYDILIVPANWPNVRYFAWKHMLIARAIENQCFVLGCNREGQDVYGAYRRGDSMVLDNWGNNISDYREDGTIYAILNAEQFNLDRSKFTPWRDADKFQLL